MIDTYGLLFVRDHIPLEQGLRHWTRATFDPCWSVRDHIPLEQGLRHWTRATFDPCWSVRDHIPLEQGLRQEAVELAFAMLLRQRPYSIRTRIKTRWRTACAPYPWLVRDHIPLEQGLRLCDRDLVFNDHSYVRDHIPLEQGLRRTWDIAPKSFPGLSETIFH